MIATSTSPQMQQIVSSVAKLQEEKAKKEKNVVIFGVKMSIETGETERKREDEMEVNRLMYQIGVNKENILSIRRLKSKDSSRISPVIIEFKDKRERNQVLRIAYLNRTETPGIFFNFTYQEQIKELKN